jgi:hypothetical protein
VPGDAELGACPASDHKDECQDHEHGFEPIAGRPMRQPFSHGCWLILRFYTVRLDRSARFPDPLDHLRFREARVVKSHRHNTAEKRRARAPDAVDLLRFLFQLLLCCPRGASAEVQDRLAKLLVPDGCKFLGDSPHAFVGDQAGVEVDHQRVVGGIDAGAYDAQLIWRRDRHEVAVWFVLVVHRCHQVSTIDILGWLRKDWRRLTFFCAHCDLLGEGRASPL